MAAGAPIQVAFGADGTVLYDVPFAPPDLPPVFARDLGAAWEASRAGALQAREGAGRGATRLFRFAGHDVLILSDRDASCWAAALDRLTGLGTAYGVSLLMRLLSLIDLLAHAPWLAGTFALRHPGVAELSPALLRAASACRINGDARLDETRLRHALAQTGVAA